MSTKPQTGPDESDLEHGNPYVPMLADLTSKELIDMRDGLYDAPQEHVRLQLEAIDQLLKGYPQEPDEGSRSRHDPRMATREERSGDPRLDDIPVG